MSDGSMDLAKVLSAFFAKLEVVPIDLGIEGEIVRKSLLVLKEGEELDIGAFRWAFTTALPVQEEGQVGTLGEASLPSVNDHADAQGGRLIDHARAAFGTTEDIEGEDFHVNFVSLHNKRFAGNGPKFWELKVQFLPMNMAGHLGEVES